MSIDTSRRATGFLPGSRDAVPVKVVPPVPLPAHAQPLGAQPAVEAVASVEHLRDALVGYAGQFHRLSAGWGSSELIGQLAGIEDLSRVVEYLQVAAAGAVERRNLTIHRDIDTDLPAGADPGVEPTMGRKPATASCSTTTGASIDGDADSGTAVDTGMDAQTVGVFGVDVPVGERSAYRTTAEFLQVRLRIGKTDANRRLRLASDLLPVPALSGAPVAARFEHLAVAVAAGEVSGRAATMISGALTRARHSATAEILAVMEAQLTGWAGEADPDFLGRLIQRWEHYLDADGTEPGEQELRARQGVFLQGKKHGLHRLQITATDEQFEYLNTVMNTATNPRAPGSRSTDAEQVDGDTSADTDGPGINEPGTNGLISNGPGFDGRGVDGRTWEQYRLDGLIGACQIALATGKLPSTGGHRPQIIATIDYRDLFARLTTTRPTPARTAPAGRTGTPDGTGTPEGTGAPDGGPDTFPRADRTDGADRSGGTNRADRSGGTNRRGFGGRDNWFRPAGALTGGASWAFGGPVNPETIRTLACDADIIPVVLGGHGEILDLGRTRRFFTSHQRQALIARDKGCAFPGCRRPAPWTEAHHITFWENGGPTDIANGCLLCTAHHHLIHHGSWNITIQNGIPWFIPPTYHDPYRKPLRNHYWTLT